ncbi:MAG TPA: septal ring lytic transglycosylase RlpA family protein [Pseudolabrys sp.]|nr:septal ring lytic transglycosylase RlpA family protein [Pseudolabrys sp.]
MRLAAVSAGALALANCSGGLSGKIDPRYGVSSSERVIEPGQPVPKGGGVYRVGKPYVVAGREYIPQEDVNYSAVGMASWYGDDFHGRYTANGEIFDMNSISAAHPTMPLPSYARVTNLANHRSIIVRVNDRGPYAHNRLIDVSVRASKLLGFYGDGLTKVKVEYVGRAPLTGSDDRKLEATLREPGMAPVQVASTKGYAPTYFDSRPLTQLSAKVPAPPDRPYRLGEGARNVPAVPARTVELAAAARPQPAPALEQDELPPAEQAVSPVSAFAPAAYDGRAGLLSGRGLY